MLARRPSRVGRCDGGARSLSTERQGGYWAALKKLLSQFGADAATGVRKAPSAAATDAARAGPVTVTGTEFAERARVAATWMGPDETVIAGIVDLPDIDTVKRSVGQRWERVSEQIDTAIRRILDKRLSRNDFFTRYGDDAYVIVFTQSSELDARLKCALLAQEIEQFLFGIDPEAEEPAAMTSVAAIPATALSGERGKAGDVIAAVRERAPPPARMTDGNERLRAALADVRTLIEDLGRRDGASRSEPAGSRLSRDRLDSLRHVGDVITSLQERPAKTSPGRTDAPGGTLRPLATLLHDLIEDAASALPPPEALVGDTMVEVDKTSISFKYTPIWYTPRNAIGVYTCVLCIETDGTEIEYFHVPRDGFDGDTLLEMDKITLRRAVHDLGETLRSNRLNAVSIPVSFETLIRPKSQQQYLALCASIGSQLKDYVAWELVNVPIDAWHRRLPPLVAPLLNHGRNVSLRPDRELFRFGDLLDHLGALRAARVRTICLDVTAERQPEASTHRRIEQLAERAEGHHLNCHLTRLTTLSFVTAAIGAGIQYLSGPIIAEAVDHPIGLQRSTAGAIYGNQLMKVLSGG